MPNYDDAHLGVENSQHPANEKEIEIPQVAIDEDWYWELKEDRAKLGLVKLHFRALIALKTLPLEKTSDEEQNLIDLEKELIKLLC